MCVHMCEHVWACDKCIYMCMYVRVHKDVTTYMYVPVSMCENIY